MKKLLELKKQMKKKRPNFIRSVAHKIKRISDKVWRKPKGLHNKMKLGFAGHRQSVNIGFRSPALVRGLHKNGLQPVTIYAVKEISKINKESQGIIIGNIGMKNKAIILSKAKELGINILNVKNPEESLKSINDQMQRRKENKEKRAKKKSEKAKTKEKKAKPKLDEKIEKEETKKDKEKKKLDKILTQKGQK